MKRFFLIFIIVIFGIILNSEKISAVYYNSYCDNQCNNCVTPAIPSVSASAGSNSETSINVSESSSGTDYYRLYRGGSYIGTNSGSYSDSGLYPGTSYSYSANACVTNCQECQVVQCGADSCEYDCASVGDKCSNSGSASRTTGFNSPSGTGASCSLNGTIAVADVSWSDNSSAESGYKIEESLDGGGFSEAASASANATSLRRSGLLEGHSYAYRIRAYHTSGSYSSYSGQSSCTTPLNSPYSLVASAVSSNQIDLSWVDNSTGESGFKIERATGSCSGFSQIGTVSANVRSYSDTGLSAGTTYCYRVRGYTSYANSDYSNTASATTLLTAPSSLAASAVSGTQINLSWTDNSTGESGFKIERATGSCSGFSQITTVSANEVSYSDTGLSAGTTYCYRVRAYTSYVNSDYSGNASATTKTPPIAPSNLSLSVASSTQINLSWTDNSGNENGFRIRRALGASCNSSSAELTTVSANVVSYNNSGLCDGTTYCYVVCAYNNDGESCSSSASNSTTLPAPSNLNFSFVSQTSIDINWTNNSSCQSGFKIERKAGVSGTWSQIATISGANSYNDSSLSCSPVSYSDYYYRVRAYTSYVDSNYATTASGKSTLPCNPSNLIASSISSSQINLSWTDNSGNESEFRLERKTGSSGSWSQFSTTTSSSFNNTGLADGTPFYYRVRACNSDGCSGYSSEASATTILPAPSNLTCSAVSSSQINLSWTDNSNNETSFKVERGTSSPPSSVVASLGQNASFYNDTNLLENTKYYYRARAYNDAYNVYSSYSGECSTTTLHYIPTGNFTSSIFDSGFSSGVNFNYIMWKGNLPTDAHVLFQFASASTTAGLSFAGPDGTSATYYESSGSNQPMILSSRFHYNHRYFRYKVFLYQNLSGQSPEISEIVVGYSP